LATVGAFRVVSSRDLLDDHGRMANPRAGDLRRLREQRLIENRRIPGTRDHAVGLTAAGCRLLVVSAGDTFKLLHVNVLDDMALARPAMVGERLLLRTEHRLYSIRRKS
jgi:hypothetical protein